MTAPTEVATLTPQALAAATIALCRPGTVTRRHVSDRDGSVTLTLRAGVTVRIAQNSWAAGGGLTWRAYVEGGHVGDDLPGDRLEAVAVMITVCESRAGA
ncbi:hypothetical protein [Nocardia sp. NPDC058480]|uniref:hypothetical protein n=1 Tax=Nocardia sp. NPDC058480 TaxID=3346522 RepID=UPI0036594257